MSSIDKNTVQVIAPTAIGTKSPQIIVLSCLYALLGLIAAFQAVSAWRFSSSRKMKGGIFRVKFLVLAFLTMFTRFILVTFPIPFWDWSIFWLFFIDILFPLWLIFVTFSLIILFLAKVLYTVQGREDTVKGDLYPKYFAVIISLFFLNIGYAFFLSAGPAPSATNYDKLASLYSVVVFFLFEVGASIYGWKVLGTIKNVFVNNERAQSVRAFCFLLYFYLSLFFLRWFWDLTHVLNVNPIQKIENKNIQDGHLSAYYSFFLGFYLLIELLPTAVLLLSLAILVPQDRTVKASSKLAERAPILRPMNLSTNE